MCNSLTIIPQEVYCCMPLQTSLSAGIKFCHHLDLKTMSPDCTQGGSGSLFNVTICLFQCFIITCMDEQINWISLSGRINTLVSDVQEEGWMFFWMPAPRDQIGLWRSLLVLIQGTVNFSVRLQVFWEQFAFWKQDLNMRNREQKEKKEEIDFRVLVHSQIRARCLQLPGRSSHDLSCPQKAMAELSLSAHWGKRVTQA